MADLNWLEILDWGPEQLEDLRFVGYSYIKEGKYDIALSFFKALVTLNPTSPYDLQTLGAIFLEKGNHLDALNYLEQSLKIAPTHLPSKLNKAKALASLGYKKQAVLVAKELEKSSDPDIGKQASALLLSFV
jgi:tetratricopeptide (TPR) repeat protein